ncbi:MAG: AAA-like domain-containing protein [Ktedonobacteraceae bacterium]|nr:AAA-like domain-containing protein [Ktedonobacteraceae bacterium]MBV9019640.1 AAA-like domain-containing protein [Ktedonobacteraceae bacterium]
MEPPHNPYSHARALQHPTYFFGRARLMSQLYSLIKNQQSVSLVGLQHIGKSSVLHCLRTHEMQRRFGVEAELQAYLFAFIDFNQHLHHTRPDFFRTICTQLIEQNRDRLSISLPQAAGEESFSTLLRHIHTHGIHPVLLLDGFDTVTRNLHFDANFFSFLRAEANNGMVSYITASFASLDTYCHQNIVGSPFFNIFITLRLGPFTSEEAHQLITTPAATVGYPFTDAEISFILELAGRHPFFIHRVCHLLFEEKLHSNSIDTTCFERVKKQAYDDLFPHFSHLWKACFNEAQQEQFKNEVRRNDASGSKMPELSESALFRTFVSNICTLPPSDVTIKALEQALKNLNNIKFLGESDLASLNLVYARADTQLLLSVTDKGMLVSKILHEACEKLRGHTGHHEGSSRIYEVLQYRYFKSHTRVSIPQIGARLCISKRQVDRDRKKGIDALFRVLCEMEMASREK